MKIWQLKQLSKLLYICAALIFTKSHTHIQIMSLQRILRAWGSIRAKRKISGQGKISIIPLGKNIHTEYQSRSRETWWLNISYKICKEIRRTAESHWSQQEPEALEEKLDLFLLSFLFVKPLTVHYLVHSESLWI